MKIPLKAVWLCASLLISGSLIAAVPPSNSGNDFDESYLTANRSKPSVSVNPRGIIELGFNSQFTLVGTVHDTDGDATSQYWTYPEHAISLVSASTDFTTATFRSKSQRGTYSVTLFSQDDRGLMNYFTVRVIVRDYLTVPPSPPRNFRKTAKSYHFVSLAWDAPSSGTVKYYHVHRRLNNPRDAWAVVATLSASSTTLTDTTVAPATSYQYVVKAENDGGFSPESNSVATTTDSLPPPPPALPNLVPNPFVMPAIANRDGTSLSLAITVSNRGVVTAFSPWYVRVTESTDAVPSADDRIIQTILFGDLLPGQSVTKSRVFTIPDADENQTYWYFATTDYNNLVSESNEADNVSVTTVTYRTFAPPSGFRCEQVNADSIQCVANRDIYETFKTYLVESRSFYCLDSNHPSCWISGLSPGLYRVQLVGRDNDTLSNEITEPYSVVVSDAWTPSWTERETEIELDQGSLAAYDMRYLQTRWGVAWTGIFREDDSRSGLSYRITVPHDYALPYFTIVNRTCRGTDAAPYRWMIDSMPLISFTSGVDHDTEWHEGAVRMSFDFQEYRAWNVDHCGIERVRIPTALVARGTPHTVSVAATANGGQWDWYLVADHPPQIVSSSEHPSQEFVSVTGPNCQSMPSVHGPFDACFVRSFVPGNIYTTTLTMRENQLSYDRPSATFWGALGAESGTFNLFLNDVYLGQFESGIRDSKVWDYTSSVLWWKAARFCTCGTDYNGWYTLTADRSLWRDGLNTISVTAAGPFGVPWSWSKWSMAMRCTYARNLLNPLEGFASFLAGSTNCNTRTSQWGSVWSCEEQKRSVPERIEFESAPTRSDSESHAVLTWLGANGIHAATHRISVNGIALLDFASGVAVDRTWRSTDEQSRLTFRYRSTHPDTDYNGEYELVVPTSLAPTDVPLMITIEPLTDGGTRDQITVFGYTDTERKRNTIP